MVLWMLLSIRRKTVSPCIGWQGHQTLSAGKAYKAHEIIDSQLADIGLTCACIGRGLLTLWRHCGSASYPSADPLRKVPSVRMGSWPTLPVAWSVVGTCNMLTLVTHSMHYHKWQQ